jgi:hypothetical protein
MTARDLTVRIIVEAPPPGVEWALQLGRDQLVPPSKRASALEFHATLRVVAGKDGSPDLRGPAVQGPRNGRFVYLNSGVRAGQVGSAFDRRAKVSLEGLRAVLSKGGAEHNSQGAVASIAGTGRDGGPACASVSLLGGGWRLESRAASR